MRSSALIALLPILATLSLARPHHQHHSHHRHSRKTLGFGPTHSHATFELLPLEADGEFRTQELRDVDVMEVANAFIQEKIGSGPGVGFYIRPDVSGSSSDTETQLTSRPTLTDLLASPISTLVSLSMVSRSAMVTST